MARTDLIADMLTAIRNAVMAKKDSAVVPASKINNAIVEIMKAQGYIDNYRPQAAVGALSTLKVYLKEEGVLQGLKRVSKPSLRVYSKSGKMPSVLKGSGLVVVSTSKGVMTDKDAREQKLGGEILCYIW